jgi:hypothetical protein
VAFVELTVGDQAHSYQIERVAEPYRAANLLTLSIAELLPSQIATLNQEVFEVPMSPGLLENPVNLVELFEGDDSGSHQVDHHWIEGRRVRHRSPHRCAYRR